MNLKLVLFVIFGLLIDELLSEIPKIRSNHAIIGNYIKLNMQTCGYVSPNGRSINDAKTRIIGGEVAEIGDFPWHVFIYKRFQNGTHISICEGVLIHRLFVITDRHCVDSYDISSGPIHNEPQIKETDLLLSFGSVKKGEFNVKRNVSLILRYPFYDLALLQIDTELDPLLSRDGSFYVINYICLPNDKALNVDPEEAIISGSGQNWIIPHNYTGPKNYNELLRKAIIRIDSPIECLRYRYPVQYICALVSVNMTCFGDSGSGLFQFSEDNRAILIGTTLTGYPFKIEDPRCSPGILVFLRVSHFINFLLDVIEFNHMLPYLTKSLDTSKQKPSIEVNGVNRQSTSTSKNGSSQWTPHTFGHICCSNIILILIIILFH